MTPRTFTFPTRAAALNDNSSNNQPITREDFGDELNDREPEMQEMAVEIANRLRKEQPGEDLDSILRKALWQAKMWWMDRAG